MQGFLRSNCGAAREGGREAAIACAKEALQLKDRSGFTSAEQQLVVKLLAEEQS